MNKLIKEGIIFSVIVLGIFALINFVNNATTFDYSYQGVPFAYNEGWGPCPQGEICHKSTPINLVFDILIVVALGFGVSYIKNSVIKK